MNFELFEPTRSNPAGRGTPTLRVQTGGRLILNAAAKRLLGDTAFVQLLWDSKTGRIALKPTTSADSAAFRVAVGPSQATITSKSFITAHNIPFNQRMKLEWDGRMWVASALPS
ncbi:MAG: hypothetical protein ACOH14_07735 [Rhodoglobus sp.]